MWLEANPRLSGHCRMAAEKARKTEVLIARILPNTGGPTEGRRQLLATVARAKLAYAAPVWGQAMEAASNSRRARGALRTGLLRIVRGYRTISTEAAEVLAAHIPGDLYIKMLAEQYWETRRTGDKVAAKLTSKVRAMERWQERWSRAQGWTRMLIPNIKRWVERSHGELTYELTQLLTGHGCFGAYRQRIGKSREENCKYCEVEADTAKHTFSSCHRWAKDRDKVWEATGTTDTEAIVAKMIEEKRVWESVEQFAKAVMGAKRKDELA